MRGTMHTVMFDITVFAPGVRRAFRKSFETTLTPCAGHAIEDTAWKEPRVPTEITVNLTENYVHVQFALDKYDTEEAGGCATQMYTAHGWKAF